MNFFISFLLLIFSLNTVSAESVYLTIKLEDNSSVSGELIERYEDRWFWEVSSVSTSSYILLFTGKKFKLIDTNKIKKKEEFSLRFSHYKNWLKKNNIIFKEHPVDDAYVLTGNEGHHKYERMYGNFAWDLAVVNKEGESFLNEGLKLEDYLIFNKPVFSPFDGVVVGAEKFNPDNKPSPSLEGSLDDKVNNYLTIKVSDLLYLSLVHFKKNSITVDVGDRVKSGQLLGVVGNSGVSYVPHLHYTLYTYIPEYDRFISIPLY